MIKNFDKNRNKWTKWAYEKWKTFIVIKTPLGSKWSMPLNFLIIQRTKGKKMKKIIYYKNKTLFYKLIFQKKSCGTNKINSTLQILIWEFLSDKQRKHIKNEDKNQYKRDVWKRKRKKRIHFLKRFTWLSHKSENTIVYQQSATTATNNKSHFSDIKSVQMEENPLQISTIVE